MCSSHTATPDRSLCEGFVTGVEAGVDTFTTGMRILHPGGNMFPALFCGANLASSDNLVAAAVSAEGTKGADAHMLAQAHLTRVAGAAFSTGINDLLRD